MKSQLSSLFLAAVLFMISILIGILGYMLIEGFTFVDAFYMTVITVSTVGFAEVQELSRSGRIFTSVYIIYNLAILAYIISVISTYLFEGRLRKVFKEYMVDRDIDKLNNHIIVCGYGRNGIEACKELNQSGFNFVVIEKDPNLLKSIVEERHYHLIIGDATHDSILKKAHTEKASAILITTPSDADNVFIILSAKELNPSIRVIARGSELGAESKMYRAGADNVVMPEHLGGMFMSHMITKPVVIEFLDLLTGEGKGDHKYRLEAISFNQLKPMYRDKTLSELKIQDRTGCTVIGVKDDLKGIIPSPAPDTFIGKDDCLILLGSDELLKKAQRIYSNS